MQRKLRQVLGNEARELPSQWSYGNPTPRRTKKEGRGINSLGPESESRPRQSRVDDVDVELMRGDGGEPQMGHDAEGAEKESEDHRPLCSPAPSSEGIPTPPLSGQSSLQVGSWYRPTTILCLEVTGQSQKLTACRVSGCAATTGFAAGPNAAVTPRVVTHPSSTICDHW